MAPGYGQALAAGIQGYITGQAQQQDRQVRQQQLTQQAMQMEQQSKRFTTSQSLLEEQLRATQMQNQQIANTMTKQNLYSAFDRGTITDFNEVLNTDKNIKNILPTVDSVEPLPNDEKYIVASRNMQEPVLVNTIKDGKLVKEIRDLALLKAATGYSSYKSKRDEEQLKANLGKTKTIVSSVALNDAIQTGDPDKVMGALKLTNPELFIGKGPKGTDLLATQKASKLATENEIETFINQKSTEFYKALDEATGDTMVTIQGEGEDTKKYSLNKIAKQAQGDKKLSSADETYIDGIHNASNAMINLKEILDSEDIEWSAIDKAQADIAKLVGTDWATASDDSKQKILNKFSFDAKLKTAMAAYIKAMSGAAVSDQERGFYIDTITKGNWSTKEAASASLKGFIEGLNTSYSNKLNSIKRDLPWTYMNKKDLYKETLNKLGTQNDAQNSLEVLQNKYKR